MCLAAAPWLRIRDMMMLLVTQWPGGMTKLAKVAAVILQLKNDIEDIIAGHGNLAYLGCLQ